MTTKTVVVRAAARRDIEMRYGWFHPEVGSPIADRFLDAIDARFSRWRRRLAWGRAWSAGLVGDDRSGAMIHRRLVITGRVQNVFYRDWFKQQADALGLDGWVRNRADGSVEAVVQGPAEMVETIVARARQGSPASRVADVAVTDAEPTILDGFEKRPTA